MPQSKHTSPESKKKIERPRWKKILLGVLATLLVFAVVVGTVFGIWLYRLTSKIGTVENAFPSENTRPKKTEESKNVTNFLILGSDARLATTEKGVINQKGNRSDALMLMQVSKDKGTISVMSIPRDSWVPIPGHGDGKINWAYSFGGAALAVQTVEQLTGVRIDHVVMADFTSFKQLTDNLGGVEITSAAGTKTYNGEQALAFVRERHHLPRGDFDRVRRQQAWMKAVITKALSKDTLSSPSKLNSLLQTTAESVATDKELSLVDMASLATSFGVPDKGKLKFFTAPVKGTGMVGDQSVVFLDMDPFKSLSQAWQKDQVAQWLEENKDKVRSLDSEPVR